MTALAALSHCPVCDLWLEPDQSCLHIPAVRDDRRPHKTSGFGAGPKSLLSHKHSNSPGGAHDHA